MIKFFLVVLFLIHLFGISNIIKSGDRNKIFIQIVALTWCGMLLMVPTLNPKPFILLVTLVYGFTFSILLWAYNKTGQNMLQLPLITQGMLALLGLIALLS